MENNLDLSPKIIYTLRVGGFVFQDIPLCSRSIVYVGALADRSLGEYK